MKPGKRLRAFRKERGLSIRAAAAEIGVSHVAFRSWEREHAPSDPYRGLLAIWTKGQVPADSWEPSRAQRAVNRSLARLNSAAAPAPTGTEG